MAKNLDSTSPPWWTLAQMLVWILQQVEMPPQYAEQLCNELNPKLIEEALDALTKALFNAICGAVGGNAYRHSPCSMRPSLRRFSRLFSTATFATKRIGRAEAGALAIHRAARH
jgi:hypothetical protein